MVRSLAALFLFAASTALAAPVPGAAPPGDSFDKTVISTLRDIHDRGADLYNLKQDYGAAYRLYEGSLLTVKPLLGHRPDVQKTIDDSLAASGKETDPARKAFLLHETIEKVRSELKAPAPAPKTEAKPKDTEAKPKDTVPVPMPMPKAKPKNPPVLKTYKVPEGTADTTAKALSGKFPTVMVKPVAESDEIIVAATADEHAAITKWLDDRKPAKPLPKPKEPAPAPRVKEPEAKPKGPVATITGTLTVQGKAVPDGTVTLVSTDAKAAKFSGTTAKNGTFSLKNVPPGKYSVIVTSKTEDAVPAKFGTKETSGLTFTATAGANQFDIELK